MTTYSHIWSGLDKETSPMCLLCGEAEEIGLGSFQTCQSLADAKDKVNIRDR
jgi:hypothetical protein